MNSLPPGARLIEPNSDREADRCGQIGRPSSQLDPLSLDRVIIGTKSLTPSGRLNHVRADDLSRFCHGGPRPRSRTSLPSRTIRQSYDKSLVDHLQTMHF